MSVISSNDDFGKNRVGPSPPPAFSPSNANNVSDSDLIEKNAKTLEALDAAKSQIRSQKPAVEDSVVQNTKEASNAQRAANDSSDNSIQATNESQGDTSRGLEQNDEYHELVREARKFQDMARRNPRLKDFFEMQAKQKKEEARIKLQEIQESFRQAEEAKRTAQEEAQSFNNASSIASELQKNADNATKQESNLNKGLSEIDSSTVRVQASQSNNSSSNLNNNTFGNSNPNTTIQGDTQPPPPSSGATAPGGGLGGVGDGGLGAGFGAFFSPLVAAAKALLRQVLNNTFAARDVTPTNMLAMHHTNKTLLDQAISTLDVANIESAKGGGGANREIILTRTQATAQKGEEETSIQYWTGMQQENKKAEKDAGDPKRA